MWIKNTMKEFSTEVSVVKLGWNSQAKESGICHLYDRQIELKEKFCLFWMTIEVKNLVLIYMR